MNYADSETHGDDLAVSDELHVYRREQRDRRIIRYLTLAALAVALVLWLTSCVSQPVKDRAFASITVLKLDAANQPTTLTQTVAFADSSAFTPWNPAGISARASDSPTTRTAVADKNEKDATSAWSTLWTAIGFLFGRVLP